MKIKENMYTVLTSWIRQYGFWLLLFVVCLLVQLLAWNDTLRFDRALIEQGQWWLLITGHVAHLNWNHFWLNMGGLLIVAVFFRRYCTVPNWFSLLLFSSLLISLALYVFNTELQRYVGMSGVLHGLFIVGAWYEMRSYPKSGAVLLVLVIGKLIWEQFTGALPGSEAMTGGHVVVDAHLYGAVAGAFYLLLHQVVHVNNRQQDGKHDQ